MPKYRIKIEGRASALLTVKTDETDPQRIFERAMWDGVPSLCANCSGEGQDFSLELGQGWQPEANKFDVVVVTKVED